VVDATHPFARQIRSSLQQGCQQAGVPLLRLERPAIPLGNACLLDSLEELRGAGTMGERLLLALGARQLAAAVAADPNAIGVVGLAGIGGARAVALSDEDTQALPPTSLAVATEDYPLSRRLLFYTAQRPSADAQAFVEFAVGAGGQDVVRRLGFVPQGVSAYDVPSPGDGDYAALVAGARRVALNFRFGEGIALLDNKALEDVDRLARFLRQPAQAGLEIVLVGFADRSEITPYAALSLSNDRVDLVAEALRREGLRVARQRGLGQIAPVASNATVPGRQRNRRVEVWLRPMAVAAGQASRRPVTSSGG